MVLLHKTYIILVLAQVSHACPRSLTAWPSRGRQGKIVVERKDRGRPKRGFPWCGSRGDAVSAAPDEGCMHTLRNCLACFKLRGAFTLFEI